MKVVSGEASAPEIGNALPLKNIPLGSIIHNIELNPGQGAIIARSAGAYAQLSARDGKYAIIKMPSGETRMILATCMATIGTVSNSEKANEVLGKAGRKRWLGRRPRVRGVAMNPVDHPMGGGEGRSKGGQPRSRNGIYSQGQKTRDTKKSSSKHIIERRKGKRNK
jgi:large subunit ribosomal protein L2